MKLEKIVFDPEGICFDVCDLIRPRFYRKPVELICRIDENLPEKVYGDPNRFRQVLLNLMSNAAKFTGSGEVVLSLGAQLDTEDQDFVLIQVSVKDTGIGMSEADMNGLFEPFRQSHQSIPREYGGTGLGLFLCKSIAGLMDGDIRVESVPGKGSVFNFTARMKVVDGGASKQYHFPEESAGKIFVADNNQTNLDIFSQMLEKAGMAVELRDSCENLPEILDRAKQAGNPFDLCIIDAALASDALDDFFYIRRIREAGSPFDDIPIIAISDPFSGNARKCQEAGFNAFLSKPVRREQLFRMIRRLIHADEHRGGAEDSVEKILPGYDSPDALGSLGTILLAEDNPVNQKLVTAILKKAGYQVDLAENGEKAVNKYLSAPDDYDLVLMDVQMPVLDGIAAAESMRQWEADQSQADANAAPRHVCIVAVTAGAVNQEKGKYIQVGIDDLLFKPIQRETLLKMIEKWLGREHQSG